MQPGGFLLAAGGVISGRRGEAGGEHGGAVGTEDPGGEELADDGEQVVFADPDGAGVVGDGGLVAGVLRVVGAVVVDVAGVAWVGAAEAAGHTAFAVAAPAPGAQQVGAAGGGVGAGLGVVAAAGMVGTYGLSGVPGGPGDDRRMSFLRDQIHWSWGTSWKRRLPVERRRP